MPPDSVSGGVRSIQTIGDAIVVPWSAGNSNPFGTGEPLLNTILLASMSLALLLATVALVRQVRLRRALELLLRRLLSHWRNRSHERTISDHPGNGRARDCDRL